MNWKFLKIYFPNYYGDIENIIILIIHYLQHPQFIYKLVKFLSHMIGRFWLPCEAFVFLVKRFRNFLLGMW